MYNVDVVTFTIIFDQVQSLIWLKIFVKQKNSFVCIEEIKFAIISEFLSPVNFGILSNWFILVDFPILYVGESYKKFHPGLHCFAK